MATTPSGSHPNAAASGHGTSDEATVTSEDADVARGSEDGAGASRPRVLLLVLAIVIGLLVAAIPLVAGVMSGGDDQPGAQSQQPQQAEPGMVGGAGSASGGPGGPGGDRGADGDADPGPEQPVSITNPRSCPAPEGATQPSPDSELAGIELPCLTSGKNETADLGAALVGKPTIINVWAWWCEPCRRELPHFDKLAKQHPEWNVAGIHLDKKSQAGADFLDELNVTTMPVYADRAHRFDTATSLPKVVPITVVYRADGTRAQMYPQVFRDYEELEAAVHAALSGQN
ncbi:TlpA disulfide reductase family protein [Corynebacterium sp. UMB4614]|uniref:TlpA family protein disulfide reductase n=1 Tax=Corynebacterium sp. UMB4614 TaxID=3046334 RepID=UPI00254CAD55|nr:TlpA disulfide reductase family protein [Corynebacterium sp. UMB4614]MDK7134940.1 TlpA disulfide reductase family protein [Corynebacterium sp. UMB4614]